MRSTLPLLLAGLTACGAGASPPVTAPPPAPARYLYIWAGDKGERSSEFLATVDVEPGSPTYGEVIASEAPTASSSPMGTTMSSCSVRYRDASHRCWSLLRRRPAEYCPSGR
jgi:hypothetical protein